MKRRVILALTIAGMMLVLSAGVAFAVTKVCDQRVCRGTGKADVLIGTEINNTIYGRGGGDDIRDTAGGKDVDRIIAGRGNDTIDVRDGNSRDDADYVDCGPGFDTVYADNNDITVRCEVVL